MKDPLVEHVLLAIHDLFSELDDSEEAPLGEFPRVVRDRDRLVIAHETDNEIQVEVRVRLLNDINGALADPTPR